MRFLVAPHRGSFLAASLPALAALTPLAARAEPPQMREHAAAASVRAESEDGRVSIALGGFLQARASLGHSIDEETGASDPLVSLARTRLYAFGHVHDPSIRYRLMLGTNGTETAFQLFDAYVEESFSPAIRLRIGRTKVPVFRAWVESARMLAGVDRDAATTALLPGREALVMLRGELAGETFEYAATVMDSGGDEPQKSPATAGRLVWNPMGRAIEGEIDFDDSPLALSLGASALVGRRSATFVGAERRTTSDRLAGGEALLRAHGLDLGGEFEVRERTTTNGDRWTVRAGYARVDYFVAPWRTALGVRASTVRSTDPAVKTRDEVELDGGFYVSRHDVKVLGEFAGAQVGPERAREVRATVQLQAAF